MVETDSKVILLGNEKKVEFNDLKDVCRELNDAIDVFNGDAEEQLAKIRVVGVKKAKVLEAWHDAVDHLADKEFAGVPASSVEFWNKYCPDPDAEAAGGEAPDGEAPDGDAPEKPAAPEKPKVKPKVKPKAKDEDKDKPKDRGNLGSSSGKQLKNFDDLKARLGNPQTPTGKLDELTLEGGTIDEILAKFKKYVADSGVPFKALNTPHQIKKHIEYRTERGWIYEGEGDQIKLVGFEKKVKVKDE